MRSRGLLESWGSLVGISEASWKPFGKPIAKGGSPAFCLGAPWGILEASEGGLEGGWGGLGDLGASWRRLGPSWHSQSQAQPMSLRGARWVLAHACVDAKSIFAHDLLSSEQIYQLRA